MLFDSPLSTHSFWQRIIAPAWLIKICQRNNNLALAALSGAVSVLRVRNLPFAKGFDVLKKKKLFLNVLHCDSNPHRFSSLEAPLIALSLAVLRFIFQSCQCVKAKRRTNTLVTWPVRSYRQSTDSLGWGCSAQRSYSCAITKSAILKEGAKVIYSAALILCSRWCKCLEENARARKA